MHTVDPIQTAAAGLRVTVERGAVSAEADARWSGRSNALAAWLMAEWKREHAAAESLPARLDPGGCPATPRQDDNGETQAA